MDTAVSGYNLSSSPGTDRSVLVAHFATPWTAARQAPLSVGFFRENYWNRLPHPPPGPLLNPGIKPRFPALQADSLPSEPPGEPRLC